MYNGKGRALNIGCGKDIREGWENVDLDSGFDATEFPWPWKNNYFNEILMSHFLEHIRKDLIIPVLYEARRVLKYQYYLEICVPSLNGVWQDFTHYTSFTKESLQRLDYREIWWLESKPKFVVVECVNVPRLKIGKHDAYSFRKKFGRFPPVIRGIFPAGEVYCCLRKI